MCKECNAVLAEISQFIFENNKNYMHFSINLWAFLKKKTIHLFFKCISVLYSIVGTADSSNTNPLDSAQVTNENQFYCSTN